jgi:hypothetical protein
MKAYKLNKSVKTSLRVNESIEGETIEQKIERIINNKEPIKDGAPIIFTERKDGVRPEHDIRTDRWDVAIDMSDKGAKDALAKRKAYLQGDKNDGKAESTHGGDKPSGEVIST